MKRLMCLVAVMSLGMGSLAMGTLTIQGEAADIFQNSEAVAGPGSASGGASARHWLSGGTPQCTYFRLESGELSAGQYNLIVSLWNDGSGRRIGAILREGLIGDDGNWGNFQGFAVPTSGGGFVEFTCTSGEGWGDPAVFTIASGTDYTLRIQGYGADTAYLDYLTFTPVPEPISMVLLGLGGLLVRRIKR